MKRSATPAAISFEVEGVLLSMGEKIRLYRRALKLTQTDLAQRAGVGLSTIVAIEKGAPTVQVGFWLSALWGLDLLDHFEQISDLGRNEKFAVMFEAELAARGKKVTP